MGPVGRSDSYLNVLAPPPPTGPSICEVCHRGTDQRTRCYKCHRHWEQFAGETADAVMPISIAITGGQLAHELGQYKYNYSAEVRRQFTIGLAGVLARFLAHHEECVADAVGVDSFDLVTCVPGTRQRSESHPLAVILGRTLTRTRGRFADVMTANGENDRQLKVDRVIVTGEVAGRAVLLVDDTWTTGASLQSAAIALKRSGARTVAGLVIGRRLDREGDPNAGPVLAFAQQHPFTWDECVLCRDA